MVGAAGFFEARHTPRLCVRNASLCILASGMQGSASLIFSGAPEERAGGREVTGKRITRGGNFLATDLHGSHGWKLLSGFQIGKAMLTGGLAHGFGSNSCIVFP